MKKAGFCFVMLLTLLLGSQPCSAARIKAYVSRFAVSVPENKDELRVALQTLLMSRLNGDLIQAVDTQADADIQIAGSYIAFGTVFSLDALVKTSSGVFIDRVFVQGDTQNELIPAVNEMAKSLRRAIVKWNPALAPQAGSEMPPTVEKPLTAAGKKESRPEAKPAVQPAVKPAPAEKPVQVAKPAQVAKPVPAVKPAVQAKPQVPKVPKAPEKPWVSERLPERLNGIAKGRELDADGTEIFVSGEHYLRYYLKGKSLQLLAEVQFEDDEKVVGIDVADLDRNGVPEIYLSLLKGGQPASQVYLPAKGLLKKVKDGLPYLLRGIALEGNPGKIFAQKMGANGSFSGDLFELAKNGDSFTLINPVQLPFFGNLYNFNRFSDGKGRRYLLVTHPDGYLLVYSRDRKQLWKSRDKFGGSESQICQPAAAEPATALSRSCGFTPPQRLLVTRSGEVLVARNSGAATEGTVRTFSKNSLLLLAWDGTALKEKLHTDQSPNYLADFAYDDPTGELLLLEVEPKADANGERGSRVVMKTLP